MNYEYAYVAYVVFVGCYTGIVPHLQELIPFLIASLAEKRVCKHPLYCKRICITSRFCYDRLLFVPSLVGH